jgi:tRNA (cmo5U34)-methyltransferase
MADSNINLWGSPGHALEYLAKADTIPHRTEGERVLLEFLPAQVRRVLDLGSGDGRLLTIVKLARPGASAVAVDFSPPMLDRLRARFASDPSVEIAVHDLDEPLPASLGEFDAVVSSFAIHHVGHNRKRALFEEVFRLLTRGGVVLNLEHVASSTPALHEKFLRVLNIEPADEDPSNKLLDVETQLAWLRSIGFVDVDCHWKWRELALLAGTRSNGVKV